MALCLFEKPGKKERLTFRVLDPLKLPRRLLLGDSVDPVDLRVVPRPRGEPRGAVGDPDAGGVLYPEAHLLDIRYRGLEDVALPHITPALANLLDAGGLDLGAPYVLPHAATGLTGA